MLVELGLVEQRYQVVLEVLNNGVTVSEVATRFGLPARACIAGCTGMPPRVGLAYRRNHTAAIVACFRVAAG